MSPARDVLDSGHPSVVSVGAGTVRLRVQGVTSDRERPRLGERPSKYGVWRAITLTLVYVLMGVHIAHWKLSGRTLAPLELNEVMHTLELGIVTAGFLFMAVAFVGTLIFGRFFCSWACHIMALQDLCGWLLAKMRIRPKPIRSRVLLVVPLLAALYMFVWPHAVRLMEGEPAPRLRILTDEDGWASFVTTDLWRNLPGPWVTLLTFALCGFVIVYFLGSRSFCQYACPYGVLFGLADRFAPGRIKLTGQCEQCGHCTAVCTSHVRVHEEIAQYGMVVDASCMKDLDCVSACPHEAIQYGFTRPSLTRSLQRSGRRAMPTDFSLAEDVVMATAFLATLLVFRGLYDAVPFLMTLGAGGIVAYGVVLILRMLGRPNVRFNVFQLKRANRFTMAGGVALSLAALFALLFMHSALIRFHEVRGATAYTRARTPGPTPAVEVERALASLGFCNRWGLVRPVSLHERLADLHLMAGAPHDAIPHFESIVAHHAEAWEARIALARTQAAVGRRDAALAEVTDLLEHASTLPASGHLVHGQVQAHQLAAQWRLETGRLGEAAVHLEAITTLLPDSAPAANNVGFLLMQMGDLEAAAAHLERAVTLEPDLARAHSNLGLTLERQGEVERARQHFSEAARLDAAADR